MTAIALIAFIAVLIGLAVLAEALLSSSERRALEESDRQAQLEEDRKLAEQYGLSWPTEEEEHV